MTKRKKPKNSKKEFSVKCASHKKQLVRKPGIKTEIASQQQMLAFLRKDIRQNI